MSANDRYSRSVTVKNRNGLHMRPAGLVATLARKFSSLIEIHKGSTIVDAKSELSILTLGATHGTELELHATGPDASQAVSEVAELLGSCFSDEATCGKRRDPGTDSPGSGS